MVLDADAVVYPLAMMVKPFDTLIADVAVAGIGRAENLAVRAE